MSRESILAGVAALLALVPLSFSSPVAAQNLVFDGQLRPRLEARDPSATATEEFVSMRTRLGLSALLQSGVSVYLQLQDVRFWGEESGPLSDFDADGLDVHQAWAQIEEIGGTELALRIGRQELALGGERLIGAVGWAQQGQSFDGLRVTLDPQGGLADAFAFRIAEEAGGRSRDEWLVGGYATIPVGTGGDDGVDVYGIFDRVRVAEDTDQATAGVRWFGARADMDARVEMSLQMGERDGSDLTAFMLGVRAGTFFADGRAKATFWYDYLSGDDDVSDADAKAFSTLFATNHKFYGYADLFLNVPAATGQRGLQDIAVKLQLDAGQRTDLGLDLHTFYVAEERGLSSSHLGEELDFTLRFNYRPGVTVQAGYSAVLQDDAMEELGLLDENMSWLYVMLNVTF